MKQGKFKQTEIGTIPEGWEVRRINDVAEVIGGGTPSTKVFEYWDGGIAWITPKDLSNFRFRYIKRGERNITKEGLDNSSAKLLPKESVLLTTRAPVGYLAIADNGVTTNQGFRSLIPNNKTISEFLFYLLKNNVEVLKSNANGTTFGELSGTTLKSLKFAFPQVIEQHSIAKILSDLDSKIELNQQMNKTLENIGQTLFKHWFIDFEFPNEKGKPYRSSGGKMVDSELGEIPKGWRITQLKEITSLIKPGTNYQPKRINKGVPFLNGRNIVDNFVDYEKISYISEIDYRKVHQNWVPEANDILITRIGTLGNVGLLRSQDLPISIHYNIIDIKPKGISYALLFFLLKSDFFQKQFHLKKKQSVQEFVTIDEVEGLFFILPDEETLRNIEKIYIHLLDKISINDTEIRKVKQIRDSLLPRLMSGQIRVPVG